MERPLGSGLMRCVVWVAVAPLASGCMRYAVCGVEGSLAAGSARHVVYAVEAGLATGCMRWVAAWWSGALAAGSMRYAVHAVVGGLARCGRVFGAVHAVVYACLVQPAFNYPRVRGAVRKRTLRGVRVSTGAPLATGTMRWMRYAAGEERAQGPATGTARYAVHAAEKRGAAGTQPGAGPNPAPGSKPGRRGEATKLDKHNA